MKGLGPACPGHPPSMLGPPLSPGHHDEAGGHPPHGAQGRREAWPGLWDKGQAGARRGLGLGLGRGRGPVGGPAALLTPCVPCSRVSMQDIQAHLEHGAGRGPAGVRGGPGARRRANRVRPAAG